MAAGRAERDRRRVAVLAVLVAVAVGVLVGARVVGVGESQSSAPGQGATPEAAPASSPRPVVRPVREQPARVGRDVLGGLRFVDVTKQVGLAARGPGGPPRPQDLDGGVAVADLDGDGDLDLLLTSAGAASGLYRNDGGRFTDVTRQSRIGRTTHATVPAFADVDADGDLDLFLGGPGSSFGRLLLNDGSGRFADRSTVRGVVGRSDGGGRRVRGADFGDVDLDGDLDLLVTDWNSSAVVAAAAAGTGPTGFETQCEYAAFLRRQYARGEVPATGDTRLFLNDGSGFFEDRTVEWGLAGLGAALPLTPQFHDLDGDGWPDLAVAGDVCTSRVFRNEAGRRFLDHTATSRAGTAENGMGSLIHDLDGDGRPDWMVTSIGYPTADGSCPRVSLFSGCSGNRVFLNRGRMQFEDATDALGLRDSWWAWGVAAADFADDGRFEVAVTNGRPAVSHDVDPADQEDVYNDAFRDDPSQLWVRRGSGAFADAAAQVGLDHRAVAFGLVPFDYDRDGRVDLLLANGGSAPTLYRNVTKPGRHWLGLRLDDPTTPGNARGLGARLEVTAASGRTSTLWVTTGGSYESQQPAEVHVGLGGDARPVRVRVWWPGAAVPQVVDVRVDRLVTITRKPSR